MSFFVPNNNLFGVQAFYFSTANPFIFSERGNIYSRKTVGFNYGAIFNSDGKLVTILASSSSENKYYGYTYGGDPSSIKADIPVTTHSFTYDGKTVYYSGLIHGTNFNDVTANVPMNNVDGRYNSDKIAWLMMYGGYNALTADITAKWNRPDDNKELTDIFNITVASTGENSSGNP